MTGAGLERRSSMLRFLVALLVVSVVVPLTAQAKEGLYEAHAGIYQTVLTDEQDLRPVYRGGMGYYFTDRFLAGAQLSFGKKMNDSYWAVADVWGLGLYAGLDLLDRPVVPYVILAADILSASDEDSGNILTGTASAGVKYVLTDGFAVFVQLDASVASEDIYNFEREAQQDAGIEGEGDGESTGFAVGGGLRFYFW
jgi:hypothetical protein